MNSPVRVTAGQRNWDLDEKGPLVPVGKSKNLIGKKSGCTGPACTQKKALLAKKFKAVTPGCTGPACSQKRTMLTINKVSGSGSCVGPACNNKETMEAKRVQSLISKGKTTISGCTGPACPKDKLLVTKLSGDEDTSACYGDSCDGQ